MFLFFSRYIVNVAVIFSINVYFLKVNKNEAATRGVLQENVFLETSQKLQENTCARVSFLNKVAGVRTSFYIEHL